ncbi:hypothetical protein Ddye_001278 [Dipteronia dyeriana]|uniref:Protein PAM68, chloroplastic n=1 Tax=Dipteronia dyeriana TaxID=168575 RepID=A0AAD9XNA0_9ROSI|nr:hypothetical protein Ddye_001278 [Dipteronia dyeriana]
MAAIAWPYKLFHSPSTSKIECSYEQSTLIQKFCTLSINYHICKCRKINLHLRKEKASSSTRTPALTTLFSFSYAPFNQATNYPITVTNQYPYQCQFSHSKTLLYATLNGPRGFGQRSPRKTKRTKKSKTGYDDEDEDENEDAAEEGVIPEIVTNRMISRMGLSVGIPLMIGVLFFPLFYYLKVVQKIDVPTWVPFIVSFIFFGTALLGVSYGIVSASWDPMREGSLLGWNEAQKNWPVFWQSLRGRSSNK